MREVGCGVGVVRLLSYNFTYVKDEHEITGRTAQRKAKANDD